MDGCALLLEERQPPLPQPQPVDCQEVYAQCLAYGIPKDQCALEFEECVQQKY